MTYNVRPLSCDPKKLKGLSERLIVSHWENNYGGAVKRLNAITAQLAGLDFATAPVFVINGLKREELIAMGSVTAGHRTPRCARRSRETSEVRIDGEQSSSRWGKPWAAALAGCFSRTPITTAG